MIMGKIWLLSILISFFCLTQIYAQSAHKDLRNGDKLYGLGKWNDAEIEYRKAKQTKNELKSNYNLGNTLMHQERANEAIDQYKNATTSKGTEQEKANAYYNLGNAYFNEKKYNESIEAYKNALKLHPKDLQSKENLAIAKRQLKIQQQQQEQQQNQKQQSQDQKDQQQNQDKSDNAANQDEQKQSENQNDQKQPENDDKNGQQQSDPQNMSKDKAEKLLQIMDNEEKKVQEKLRRGNPSKKSRKNW
ncbi:MAG: tetratricopeptide repeat protein [Saprospiraceae bacterium]